jgi:DNA-binding IclR family transcriptional regulator
MPKLNQTSDPEKSATRTPGLKVLNALSWIVQENSSEVGVREMALGLGLSPSTAHRLLSELVKADFVQHNTNTGRYSLSLEFIRLSHLTIAQVSLEQVAITHMRRLTNACNETSLLSVYDRMRQEMMFVAIVDSTHPLRYSIELNKWLPVHVGASGLAIMAFLSEAEISTIIDRTRLAPVTSRSITERYRLEAEIQAIRQRGYAITRGQRTPDAVGLGAPVFGSNGEVVGDICLTIPESRFNQSAEKGIAELLKDCAHAVSVAIGGKVPAPYRTA